MDFGLQAPEKTGYRFNEITSLTGVKPYVLRFWESEFEQIKPELGSDGQKSYSKEDLLVVQTIKKLLFEDKLSIPEAKGVLDAEIDAILKTAPEDEAIASPNIQEQSHELKAALEDIIEKNSNLVFSDDNQAEQAQAGGESDESSERFSCKASPLASRIQREVKVKTRNVSESDVIKLVSAKKKLSKLLELISEVEAKHGW